MAASCTDGHDTDRHDTGRRGTGNRGSCRGPRRRVTRCADSRAGPPFRRRPARSRHSAGSPPVRHARGGTRRGRRGIWLIGGAVAAIVIGAVSLHVLLGGGHASNGLLSATTGKTSSSPAPTPAATPSQRPATPGAFDGSWSGVVTQPPTDTYHVSVTLAAGTAAGTISYSGTGFSCSGALTLTSASPRKLLMRQGIINGQSKCENGKVTITLTGTNKIWFSFHSSGPIASGSLARSSR